MGIFRIKLKMGKDWMQNQMALEAIRTVFGRDYDLKADVNGVWNRELAFNHLGLIENFCIRVVEEPMDFLTPGFVDFAKALRDRHVLLMADEAACSFQDIENIAQHNYYTMINVRLSKCGGFRRTFKIVDFLRKEEIVFQIACHLGESGILSAAGRALSLLCRDAAYYDGSYDEFLLRENTTVENVSFAAGGIAGPLKGYGLGVQVNRQKLELLSMDHDKMTITRS
jgi:muconate cycloisomerase